MEMNLTKEQQKKIDEILTNSYYNWALSYLDEDLDEIIAQEFKIWFSRLSEEVLEENKDLELEEEDYFGEDGFKFDCDGIHSIFMNPMKSCAEHLNESKNIENMKVFLLSILENEDLAMHLLLRYVKKDVKTDEYEKFMIESGMRQSLIENIFEPKLKK
jgi:hypothetical protein